MKALLSYVLAIFLILNSAAFASENFNLAEMQKNPASQFLRQTFDVIVKDPTSDLADPGILKLQKKQLKLMQEKFLPLEISSGDFGGYFLKILIAPQTPKGARKFYIWNLWIYDISGSQTGWQIRYLKEYSVKKEDVEKFLPLLQQENSQAKIDEDAAKKYKLQNPQDAENSAKISTKYLTKLGSLFKENNFLKSEKNDITTSAISDKIERKLFAFAAYNGGIITIAKAQMATIAQKKNPAKWEIVKTFLRKAGVTEVKAQEISSYVEEKRVSEKSLKKTAK